MKVTRLSNNPIITPQSSDSIGDNVNGPSLIRVPDWIPNPLGKYYLYFAHHDGDNIRLAYSDDIAGPWHIHTPGVLPLAQSGFAGHIASPDVHVDHAERRIRMYFHGCETSTRVGGKPQLSRVATSSDGLEFSARNEDLGKSYFRVFEHDDAWFALQMPGLVLRSEDAITNFVSGPEIFAPTVRHSAVAVRDNRLCILYTNVGDSPESILQSWIDLTTPWEQWTASPPTRVLAPEHPWEGADQPLEASTRGIVDGPVNQLRDPAIYIEGDDAWLLYVIAGEYGIAIAKIDSWD